MNRETLGLRLKRLRRAAGLTQAELAAKIQVPLPSLLHWEQDNRVPRLDALLRLAAGLGVPIEELAAGIAPKEKRPKVTRGRPSAEQFGQSETESGGDKSETERRTRRRGRKG